MARDCGSADETYGTEAQRLGLGLLFALLGVFAWRRWGRRHSRFLPSIRRAAVAVRITAAISIAATSIAAIPPTSIATTSIPALTSIAAPPAATASIPTAAAVTTATVASPTAIAAATPPGHGWRVGDQDETDDNRQKSRDS